TVKIVPVPTPESPRQVEPKPVPTPEAPPKVAAKPEPKPPREVKPPMEPKPSAKPETAPSAKKEMVPSSRKKAIEAYERIIREAPDSPEAAKARERLAELRVAEKPSKPGRVPPKTAARPPLSAPPAGE